ncbi:HET domain-containing protein [Colletotrichum tofieldiae]|nr:HET domain-containing protein [Colletotrichum tofieldiae]GKT76766.1 HET domain-containing protein [Colletotrichum tofieldiae]GKT97423.1 HET domain-containing protein [Colletotrichum tofieldiae]
MHVFVVPASPKTGQATIRALLDDASQPYVTGVYRDLERVPAEFRDHARFTAIKGDVANVGTLKFAGADAIVTITPPLYSEANPIARAREMAANVKYAIGQAGDSVRRLVYVSSVGAHLEHGTGEIKTNYEAEQVLIGAAPEVVFVRCAYFMENWATALGTLKAEPPFFYSAVCPDDFHIPMASFESDVAE